MCVLIILMIIIHTTLIKTTLSITNYFINKVVVLDDFFLLISNIQTRDNLNHIHIHFKKHYKSVYVFQITSTTNQLNKTQ